MQWGGKNESQTHRHTQINKNCTQADGKKIGSKREEQTVKRTTTDEKTTKISGDRGKHHKPLAFLPISE
jgi:hypothetical protein